MTQPPPHPPRIPKFYTVVVDYNSYSGYSLIPVSVTTTDYKVLIHGYSIL